MKKIKVLMVIALFYPYIGGAEKQAQKLASELVKKNVDVALITGRWSNKLKKHEEIEGLKVIRNFTNFIFCRKGQLNTSVSFFQADILIKNSRLKTVKVFFRKIFVRISVYIYQVSLFSYLLINKNKYDIIHTHQVLYPAFISTVCARILKKPVIAKVGSSGFNSDINQIKKLPEGKLQLKYILHNIDRLLCTSSKMHREFLDAGMDEDRIVIIRNGVKTEPFVRSYESCNTLAYLGRLIKSKDIPTLINAFSIVIRDHSNDLKLILIGDGPEKENITGLIKESGMEKSISITGMVDYPGEFLKQSDVFVFPTLIEGLSNSLIEAMSFRLPCIVTNIPGNIEVMGETGSNYNIKKGEFKKSRYGILFNPLDEKALVKAIVFLLENPRIREKTGESAFEKIRGEFDIDVISDKYINLYRELLKK